MWLCCIVPATGSYCNPPEQLSDGSYKCRLPTCVFGACSCFTDGALGTASADIDFSHINLTTFDSTTLDWSSCSEATGLRLYNCNLTSLTQGMFVGAPETLTQLVLNQNRINLIESGAFDGLAGLTSINLHKNFDDSPAAVAAAKAALEVRKIRNDPLFDPDHPENDLNQLGRHQLELEIGAFRNLGKLKSLDLTSNGLWGQLREGLFDGLDNLEQLLLQVSGVDAIPSGTFRGIGPKFDYLNLFDNNLRQLNASTFSSLSQCKYLLVGDNKIESMASDTFTSNPTLTSSLLLLMISGNQLELIDGTTFNGMTNMVFLTISGNQIRSVHPDAFKSLSSVRVLDLHGNKLEVVLPGTFDHLSSSQMDLRPGSGVDLIVDLSLPSRWNVTLETLVPALLEWDRSGTLTIGDITIPQGLIPGGGTHTFPDTPEKFRKEIVRYVLWVFNGKLTGASFGLLGMCEFNETLGKVQCDCGKIGWNETLQYFNGTEEGTCVCPEGTEMTCGYPSNKTVPWVYDPSLSTSQSLSVDKCYNKGGFFQCTPCPQGSAGAWNTANRARIMEPCKLCRDTPTIHDDHTYTEQAGQAYQEYCTDDPTVLKQREADANAREADANAQALWISIGCSGLVALALAVVIERIVATHELKKRLLKQTVVEQRQQIEYYRDWRINAADLTFNKKLATGSEGEVWQGTLRGYFGDCPETEGAGLCAGQLEVD